jgi:hypothetical protein
MKKNIFYFAIAAIVVLCNISCGSEDDDVVTGKPVYNLPEYANKAVAFTIPNGVTSAENANAKMTGMNFTESGKAVFEVTESGVKKYAIYNVKIDGGTYNITSDNGKNIGTVVSTTTRGSSSTTVNVDVKFEINGVIYTYKTTDPVAAKMTYDAMSGGDNLNNIARTWKPRSMKLTLEGDITPLSMIEYSGKLSSFVEEVKKRDTGFSPSDIDELNKDVKSITFDKTGMFSIEYVEGTCDVANWKWSDSNYANIALSLKEKTMGNKFIQDNSKVGVKFTTNTCLITLSTQLTGGSNNQYTATLQVNLE